MFKGIDGSVEMGQGPYGDAGQRMSENNNAGSVVSASQSSLLTAEAPAAARTRLQRPRGSSARNVSKFTVLNKFEMPNVEKPPLQMLRDESGGDVPSKNENVGFIRSIFNYVFPSEIDEDFVG